MHLYLSQSLSIWPPPARGEGSAPPCRNYRSALRSTKLWGHGGLLPWAGGPTRSHSMRPTGRCLSLNFWWGASCSPPRASFPADGNEANKEIDSIFQNVFTSVRLSLQQEKTTSRGLLQHLERSDSIPYIFMPIDFFASKMLIYLKGHFYFKKFLMKGFRVPLTLDYVMFPLTPESQNAQSRISTASFYFVFPWILLLPQSRGLLPQDSTGEGLANAEHIWRP